MVDAMSLTVTSLVPPSMGPYLAPITALLSAPFTYFISNDAFYFGVLPILAESAGHHGLSSGQIARAYLLVGLAGIEFADLTRVTLKWALAACGVFLLAALATGAVVLSP